MRKFGGTLWNQPLKITKWGHFKDSKWSRHKIETFRGAWDCFGPLLAQVTATFTAQGHGNFMPTVFLFLRHFFIFGLLYPPPPRIWIQLDFFLAPKWPSLSLVPFGAKIVSGPSKCLDFESLKCPHSVIFKGWFHVLPHLQHRDIVKTSFQARKW